mmetsp:Transcript_13559/g.46856  ORF Transcript_13559/g.46856 Transcript_13559/m.46856 type:complete len:392 (+) Transcript_13559:1648-2823(+)
MKNSLPVSPCLMMLVPGEKSLVVAAAITASRSWSVRPFSSSTDLSADRRTFFTRRSWSGPSMLSKDWRSRHAHSTSPLATTLAARGSSLSSARSPKYAPLPRCATSLSSFTTTTLPLWMRKKASPTSPCWMMTLSFSYTRTSSAATSFERSSRLSDWKSATVPTSCCSSSVRLWLPSFRMRWYVARSTYHSAPSAAQLMVSSRSHGYSSASCPKHCSDSCAATNSPLSTRKNLLPSSPFMYTTEPAVYSSNFITFTSLSRSAALRPEKMSTISSVAWMRSRCASVLLVSLRSAAVSSPPVPNTARRPASLPFLYVLRRTTFFGMALAGAAAESTVGGARPSEASAGTFTHLPCPTSRQGIAPEVEGRCACGGLDRAGQGPGASPGAAAGGL